MFKTLRCAARRAGPGWTSKLSPVSPHTADRRASDQVSSSRRGGRPSGPPPRLRGYANVGLRCHRFTGMTGSG
jgi:hypothetical protein